MRYRALVDDPIYANVPGKIELDAWGRLLMTPPSNYHGAVQARLGQRLAALGGEAFIQVAAVTSSGAFVADVAWASAQFIRVHSYETPYTQPPELCIEVAAPSNSRKEMREKLDAYVAAGAEEVWIVYLQSKRCEFYGKEGLLQRSRFAVDLSKLFD